MLLGNIHQDLHEPRTCKSRSAAFRYCPVWPGSALVPGIPFWFSPLRSDPCCVMAALLLKPIGWVCFFHKVHARLHRAKDRSRAIHSAANVISLDVLWWTFGFCRRHYLDVTIMPNKLRLLIVISNKLLFLLPNAGHGISHDDSRSRRFFMGMDYISLSVYYSKALGKANKQRFMSWR